MDNELTNLETRLKKLENIFYGISDDPRVKEVIRKNIVVDYDSSGSPIIIDKFGKRYAIGGSSGGFTGLSMGEDLTISGGSITPISSFHQIDTEGSSATDDLDTIVPTDISNGSLLLLTAVSSSRTVVLKDGTGNLILAGDFALDDRDDKILLVRTPSGWVEISRSDNG
jgi:hypothetical protein